MGGGRLHAPTLTAPARDDAGRIHLHAPAVGHWRPRLALGDVVRAGDLIGELTVLGVVHPVLAGAGSRGAVVAVIGRGRVHLPIDHGAAVVELDPDAVVGAAATGPADAAADAGGLVLRAPSNAGSTAGPAPASRRSSRSATGSAPARPCACSR